MTPMIIDISWITAALVLFFAGAESLVKGSSSLALRMGLSRLMVGLTIVAFGTSMPELTVSIKAALSQQGDISVGNAIGSNSFNIGIILGLTALICPIPVNLQIIRFDAPIALGIAFLLPVFMLDRTLGRAEGLLLFIGIAGYTWVSVILGHREKSITEKDISVPVMSRNPGLDVVFILGGLGILILGSRLLVDHSVSLAKALGVSEAVISLTIVAAGTGMPEFATSVVAAIRRQPDIAIGNIVGSNIFNVLAVLGAASLVSPLHTAGVSAWDYGIMIIFTVLLIPMLYTGRILHRIEGAVLLSLYGMYLFTLWPNK